MSSSYTFMTNFTAAIQNLVNAVQTIQALDQQISSDSSLFANYFSGSGLRPGQAARTDITASDAAAAYQACQNMVNAYLASGQGGLSGANYAYLVKMTQP